MRLIQLTSDNWPLQYRHCLCRLWFRAILLVLQREQRWQFCQLFGYQERYGYDTSTARSELWRGGGV